MFYCFNLILKHFCTGVFLLLLDTVHLSLLLFVWTQQDGFYGSILCSKSELQPVPASNPHPIQILLFSIFKNDPSVTALTLWQCWRSSGDERSLISDSISLEVFGWWWWWWWWGVQGTRGVKLDLLFLSRTMALVWVTAKRRRASADLMSSKKPLPTHPKYVPLVFSY